MEREIIEKAAAQALLDRGVGFQIPAPFFLRWFGKKRISISVKRLRAGTLLCVSQLVPPDELTASQSPEGGKREQEFEERKAAIEKINGEALTVKMEFIRERTDDVCKAIACGLLNSKLKIRLFSKLLANHLKWNCTHDQLQELALWIFAYGRAESFMITTKFLRTMRTTPPMNLGPTEEMS